MRSDPARNDYLTLFLWYVAANILGLLVWSCSNLGAVELVGQYHGTAAAVVEYFELLLHIIAGPLAAINSGGFTAVPILGPIYLLPCLILLRRHKRQSYGIGPWMALGTFVAVVPWHFTGIAFYSLRIT